jgi:hypothetical protein
MGIYDLMGKDWKTYCLMSAIIFIEEMNKPHEDWQIKRYKDKQYRCLCFSSLEIRMIDKDFLENFFKITKNWQEKLNKHFIGDSFDKVKIDKFSGQYKFILSPTWLAYIIRECGKIPNRYSFKKAIKRIAFIRQIRNEKVKINLKKNLFKELFKNKILAAGAFIVSFDTEFRGIQTGLPSLCMSDTYKDFLGFMLSVARKWNWTKNKSLSPVKVDYSRNLGIDASPQFEFRLNMNGLKEIYHLAGPLAIERKEKCIKFHVNRSENYKNLGGKFKESKTKERIYEEVRKGKDLTTTNLQFVAGVRVDVVLDHLHKLEDEGKIKKERNGKGYIWNIK